MKKTLLTIIALLLPSIMVWAEGTATMSLSSLTMKAGEEKTLGLELNNPNDEVTGIQCDLYLPSGIKIKTDQDGEYIFQVADRINSRKPHTLDWAVQHDGAMRFLNYSSTNQLFKGTSGALIEVELVADNNLEQGDYEISLRNIVISHTDGSVVQPEDFRTIIKIQPSEFYLTYMLDGTEYYKELVSVGSSIAPRDVPEREGYTFSGWEELPESMPNHDVTVYGSYVKNMYKVTFIADGTVVSENMQEYGSEISTPDAPSKEGYTFAGWGEVDITVPARDVTYTAAYTVNVYELVYEVDGTEMKSESLAFGSSITPLDEPQKEGYTFSGWSEIPRTMPARDVKVTGTFAINTYKVSFVVDGETVYDNLQEYGSSIVIPEVSPKEGHTFAGFGEVDETVPAHDVTYTGSYTVNTYKVTFIADGTVVSENMQEYGSEISTPDAPSKEGYTFAGWNAIDEYGNALESLPVFMPAMNLTITASWSIDVSAIKNKLEACISTLMVPEIDVTVDLVQLPKDYNYNEVLGAISEIRSSLESSDGNALVAALDIVENVINPYKEYCNENGDAISCIYSLRDDWGTLVLPFDFIIPSEWNIFTCEGLKNNGYTLEINEQYIGKQYTPYLVHSTHNVSVQFIGHVKDGTINNVHYGVLNGCIANSYVTRENEYVLQNQNGVIGFYRVNTQNSTPVVEPFHCYLSLPTATAKVIRWDGITDGIEMLDVENDENEIIYNLQGQHLMRRQSGVNIVNGKKVLFK